MGFLALAIAIVVPASAEEKSLYERIGGYKGVAAAVDDLVDRLYVNKTLNQNTAINLVHEQNERAAFKLILATWVMENTGGPKIYFGRDMGNGHAHLSISNREFDIVLTECKTTFYQLGVGEKEIGELMAGLEAQREEVVTAKSN
ncbi:MAG: hypothetical protein APF80_03510 [Alphaproteobacteria bacterium BRH_c36]|nr:MAG: hypothetical protein APF80_03510 [Alphaproteobacteria bacterium BRH_c36]